MDLVLVQGHWDGIILAWLAEHWKNSKRTANSFADYLVGWKYDAEIGQWSTKASKGAISFRGFLHEHGIDFDAPPAIIAAHAQAWAVLPTSTGKRTGQAVSASTHNVRLSAVSSFYEYTIRHDLYVGPNPLDRVKRMKRQLYTGAKPLPFKDGEIEQTIEAIPTKSLNGIRDKAMLYLALYTGRRLSEIAGLRCGDIERQKRDWVFTWHTKGNKTKTDILSMKCPAIPALAKWLKLFYKGEWPQDGIVFPSLSRATYGKRMSPQGLEQRCDRWLDTTKFHRLRHTFSAAYLESGGTVQGLSKQLGHANIAITTAYIESLDDGKNEQLDGMIDVYAGKQHRRSS